jgi:hypothetical protein
MQHDVCVLDDLYGLLHVIEQNFDFRETIGYYLSNAVLDRRIRLHGTLVVTLCVLAQCSPDRLLAPWERVPDDWEVETISREIRHDSVAEEEHVDDLAHDEKDVSTFGTKKSKMKSIAA